jgi:predicted nucleic acid-binding protein
VPIVVDASVTLAWCLLDEQSAYADRVRALLEAGETALVPSLWVQEVANGLLIAERRNRMTAGDLPRVTSLLLEIPITLIEPTLDQALGAVIELARREGLTGVRRHISRSRDARGLAPRSHRQRLARRSAPSRHAPHRLTRVSMPLPALRRLFPDLRGGRQPPGAAS